MEEGLGFAHFLTQVDAMGRSVLALLLILSHGGLHGFGQFTHGQQVGHLAAALERGHLGLVHGPSGTEVQFLDGLECWSQFSMKSWPACGFCEFLQGEGALAGLEIVKGGEIPGQRIVG